MLSTRDLIKKNHFFLNLFMGNSQFKQVTCTKNDYYVDKFQDKHTEWSAKVNGIPYTYFHFILSVLPVAEKSTALV